MDFILIFVAIILGILLGIITGLTPGIHINLVSSLIVAYSYYILKILDPLTITITITAMAVTHSILDIIPTTILGIPNSDNLSTLLPAHKLTLEGKAMKAILYGLLGAILGIIITTISIPFLIKLIPLIYTKVKEYIPLILIVITTVIISQTKNKINSLIFFLVAGILGILSFNIKTMDQPLLPLLSGVFGISALLLGIKNKIKIPDQEENIKIEISKLKLIKYSITTAMSSFLTNFLPGLTSSHTALISNKISKVENQEEYIILSNAANSSATIISFIAFYTINKTRSGAVAAIQYLITTISLENLILITAVVLITTSISTILALKLSKKIIKIFTKLDYKKINIIIIFLIVSLVILITRLEGLLILITSTILGILTEKLNIEKINITGCLIFPVILYSLI